MRVASFQDRLTLMVATLATATLLAWTACSASRAEKTDAKPLGSRKPAPDFALKDSDGRTVRLSDYRGKVVVLDFWATWCGPCKQEVPWFSEFERKDKDRGFAVLGVAMDDEGWSVVKPFIKDSKVSYRVVLGDDNTAALFHGVDALPTTYLIDREGRIAATHVGLTPKEDFENAIDQLLQDHYSGGVAPARLLVPAGAEPKDDRLRAEARNPDAERSR